MKQRFYDVFISKLLKKINPKKSITLNAKQQLNSALIILSNFFANKIIDLTSFVNKKTISEKEIVNSIKLFLLSPLQEKILESLNEVSKINSEKKKRSRQNKYNLIFPVSLSEKILRKNNNSVTELCPVYFTVLIENIAETILNRASEISIENNRVRIAIRDIELSVQKNSCIKDLFSKAEIIFLGGGIIPHIEPILMRKRKKKLRKRTEERFRKFRPGTVAIKEIKKHQKDSNFLLIPKLPFEKIVRKIVSKHDSAIRISKNIFLILQHYIESYIVKILEEANLAAIHRGRTKVTDVDIIFINRLHNRNYDIVENNIEEEYDSDSNNSDDSNDSNNSDSSLKEEKITCVDLLFRKQTKTTPITF